MVGGPEVPDFVSCIVCGSRGWSDAIVNVLLFMPFGAALAGVGRRGTRAILTGFILSCSIELAQTMIPGRDPSLGDVTFNTIGTAAGQAVAWLAPRWVLPGSRSAARLSLLASLAAFAVIAATGHLLDPPLPTEPLLAWYAPDLPELAWYHGRVLRTTLGGEALRPGRPPEADALERFLFEAVPLQIDAVAGHRPPSLAPLLALLDGSGHEVLLVGPDRDDLVFRYRSRASDWRLDQPDLRLRRAFAFMNPGDSLQVAVRREGRGYCLSLNRAARCDVGYSVGSGWSLLYYPHHFPAWAYTLLETGWVAGLALPIGLWARRRPETALALALLALALFVPPAGLIRTPGHELAGAGAGLVVGRLVQAWRRALNARAG